MKALDLIEATGQIDDRIILEVTSTMKKNVAHTSKSYKRIFILAAATILMLSFGIVAYAADLFGLRAMLMADSNNLSLTQPQDVPEEMGGVIREKIDNSTRAWAEWEAWFTVNGISQPEVFIMPEGCSFADYVENDDGSVTIIFCSYEPALDEAGKVMDYKPIEIERRTATAKEYEQETAYAEAQSKGFGDYDYNYHVYTQEMSDKLESIAASYGLKLRHQGTTMYENFDDHTEFSTREEITTKINEVCAGGGRFFRTEPTGYEKFYYFDEGTFAVNFFTTDDLTNTGTSCYLYNSPYGTLSSGFEIFDYVQDTSAFNTRSHTTPDGTELTVLQNGSDMYAYVYLENSFVTLHIMQIDGLSDAEIDAFLDMVDFSTIA